ncbi:MAG: hypothetical protein HDR44_00070 [Allobaculum sp.]|nr:hypothetical protein [Allobaculum sp.]
MAKPTASSSGGITFGFGMSGFLSISNRKAGLLMMAILFVGIELFIELQGMILLHFYLAHFSFHLLKRIIAQATHPSAFSQQAKRRYRKLVLTKDQDW